MVLLFTEKKIYQKELMIIMKQIKKINLKSQVRAELEEYIHSLDLDVANKLPREEELCRILGISRVTLRSVLDDRQQRELSPGSWKRYFCQSALSGNCMPGFDPGNPFSGSDREQWI